jgi:hypothetical protein
MIGHGNAAIGAFYIFPTAATAYEIIVSASVEEKYCLLTLLLIFYETAAQLRTDW